MSYVIQQLGDCDAGAERGVIDSRLGQGPGLLDQVVPQRLVREAKVDFDVLEGTHLARDLVRSFGSFA